MNGGQLAGGNSKRKKAVNDFYTIEEKAKEYMKDICATCIETENCSSSFATCLVKQAYIDGLSDNIDKIKELEKSNEVMKHNFDDLKDFIKGEVANIGIVLKTLS